jgi:hypothetical protein
MTADRARYIEKSAVTDRRYSMQCILEASRFPSPLNGERVRVRGEAAHQR